MTSPTTHDFHPSSLREYDIRGIIGETLGTDDAYAIGRGFGTLIARDGGTAVATGFDGRESSPMLEDALVLGLNDAGINAISVGMGPTPMLYYAESVLKTVQGSIMITGSHNPANYNGFKMVFQGRPFFGADILGLGTMATNGDWDQGTGSLERIDIEDDYVERLLKNFTGGAFKVGWDCGNGAAGPVIEKLTRLLTDRGAGEHHLLYTDVDGSFPNHHPDPTEEKNLADLKGLVEEKGLDFGVAFDGDGDRIGAIDGEGRVIWGDQLLQIYAEDVLKSEPGATIIADVKASQALYDRIAELGGKPLMWKPGHSLIKSKMKETGSPLAGEMSGHVFFKERWFGFDDGLYAGVRLLEILSRGSDPSAELNALPNSSSTPELQLQTAEGVNFDIVKRLQAEGKFPSSESVNTIDGVRAEYADGFGLARPSNTTPVVVMRFEADSDAALARIQGEFKAAILAVAPDVKLPF